LLAIAERAGVLVSKGATTSAALMLMKLVDTALTYMYTGRASVGRPSARDLEQRVAALWRALLRNPEANAALSRAQQSTVAGWIAAWRSASDPIVGWNRRDAPGVHVPGSAAATCRAGRAAEEAAQVRIDAKTVGGQGNQGVHVSPLDLVGLFYRASH
jgi:hypothetical protein